MLFFGKTETIRVRVVLVTMQLHEQQHHAGEHKPGIGSDAAALERGTMAPDSQQGHHASERYGAPAAAGHVAEALGLRHTFVDIDNPG